MAFIPIDGQAHDSLGALPSKSILNGSDTPAPSSWTIKSFPNHTQRNYGTPVINATGSIAVVGCDDSALTTGCNVFFAKASDAQLASLPSLPDKLSVTSGPKVLIDGNNNVFVNTASGAFEWAFGSSSFVRLGTTLSVLVGVNAAGQILAKEGDAGNLHFGSLSNITSGNAVQAYQQQTVVAAVGLNARGQTAGVLAQPSNAAGPAFFVTDASTQATMPVGGVAVQYTSTTSLRASISGLNDSGQIVGYFRDTGNSFVSNPDGAGAVGNIPVAGQASFQACCVNNKGQIAGQTSFYAAGIVTDLQKLTSFSSIGLSGLQIFAINDAPMVVGVASNSQGVQQIVTFVGQ